MSVAALSEWLTMVSAGAFYFAINQTHVIQTGPTAAMIYFPHPHQVRLEIFVMTTLGIGNVVGLFVTITSLCALYKVELSASCGFTSEAGNGWVPPSVWVTGLHGCIEGASTRA